MIATSRAPSRVRARGAGRIYGAIEAGGTKWVCAIGDRHHDMLETTVFPTTEPQETIARALTFFAANGPLAGIGIGCFGPIDLRSGSPTWGRITSTAKPGWSGVDIAAPFATAFGVPIALDTDVNVAAVAEHRAGAASGVNTFCYITVGTGIGGGVMINGTLLHGLLHPELGHMRVPHDFDRDPFAGVCPYHHDCLEGLASGDAIRQRWGFTGDHKWHKRARELEAEYLALGILNVIYTLSPERIILGGGVMKQTSLLPLVRKRVSELAAGYVDVPELTDGITHYLIRPALGDDAGVRGALALARLSTAER